MGYYIELVDPVTKETCPLPAKVMLTGSTYAVGGTKKAFIDITYNYAPHFYKVLGDEGIRSIYGMTGKDSVPILNQAIEYLKDDVTDNYWDSTEGNAKQALIQMKVLALMCPDGIWAGN